jgi:hypothetical protein
MMRAMLMLGQTQLQTAVAVMLEPLRQHQVKQKLAMRMLDTQPVVRQMC